MLKKFTVILSFLLVVILTYHSFHIIHYGFANTNENEIKGQMELVLKGAVEDDSWLYIDDKIELKQVLAQYYGETLLEQMVEKTWQFTCQNTDWYDRTELKSFKINTINQETATIVAVIQIKTLTKDGDTGNAYYQLKRIDENWKIIGVSYQWQAVV